MHNYFQNKAEVIIGRIEGVALNIVRKITLASVINKMPNLKQKISN